jgi:hypothetical protein
MRNRRAAISDTSAPTLVSRVARRSRARALPSRARYNVALGAIGVGLGTTAGVVLALGSGPTESAASSAPPAQISAKAPASVPSSLPASLPASLPPAAGTPPDLRAALVVQIKDVLGHFLAWSGEHPGARCPEPVALGVAGLDPWGHPLRIVCADQPTDQIAGVLSLGPDGLPGTRDDVVSWALGPEVTDLVRGPRWASTKRAPAGPRAKHRPNDHAPPGGPPLAVTRGAARETPSPASAQPPAGAPPASGSGAADSDSEGIPNRR